MRTDQPRPEASEAIRARWSRSGHPTQVQAVADVGQLLAELDALRQQLAEAEELHRMQLAAVMAAALGNTRSTAGERIGRENPYWTAAYHDVCNAVDREMEHREKRAEVEAERARLKGANLRWQEITDGMNVKAEALTAALSALEKRLRAEAAQPKQSSGWMITIDQKSLLADELAALLAAHTERP